jgi:hypothetical protein
VQPLAGTTTEGLPGKCPAGYYVVDCNPETICGGNPPHCHIVNVCDCAPIPFPLPFPDIPTQGGPVLPKLELVTVAFQGDTQYDGSSTGQDASAFGDFVVQSQWLQKVTADYRSSSPFAATHVAHYDLPPVGGTVDVPTLLTNAFDSHAIPFPTSPGGYLYEVFVPQAQCNGGESRHDSLTYNSYYVAWAQVCGNAVVKPGNSGASHELIEAITDPYGTGYTFRKGPNTPWSAQDEVSDTCEGVQPYAEGAYTLATAWSNKAAEAGGVSPCIPATSAYYNVSPSAPLAWDQWNTTAVTVAAGSTVNVELVGWSAGAPANATWDVGVVPMMGVTLPMTMLGPTGSQPWLVTASANAKVTLQITVPAGMHGVWSWVDVRSYFPGSSGTYYGVWPIMVSVP